MENEIKEGAELARNESKFGKKLLKQFGMDDNYININHASVGMEPKCVSDRKIFYMREINKNPEFWFRYKLTEEIDKCREAVASFIGCSSDELAFVKNATEAFQDVLSAIDWKEGDTLLYTSVGYPAIKNQIRHLCLTHKMNAVEIPFNRKHLNDRKLLCDLVEEYMIAHKDKNLRAFAFDHISSTPSFILPVNEIISLCEKYKCLSLCDGAHSVGHIPLDIHSMRVDYYISNMHKWAFTPRPFAFIFIKKSLQENVHPSVIGNNYGQGFVAEFNVKGTYDPSCFLTACDALNFRKELGESDIIEYSCNLAYKAGQIFSKMWGMPLLIEDRNLYANIVCVQVPFIEKMEDMQPIITKLLLEQHFYLVVFQFDGNLYSRICATIYNEESDFYHCATLTLQYINQFRDQQKLTSSLQIKDESK